AKAQIQSAHLFPGDLTALVAFHDEGSTGGGGDQVDSVGIAVEIFFEDSLGIKNTQVCTQTSNTFIFRSVHSHALTGVRTTGEQAVISAFGTGHGAAIPAAIVQPLGEPFVDEDLG